MRVSWPRLLEEGLGLLPGIEVAAVAVGARRVVKGLWRRLVTIAGARDDDQRHRYGNANPKGAPPCPFATRDHIRLMCQTTRPTTWTPARRGRLFLVTFLGPPLLACCPSRRHLVWRRQVKPCADARPLFIATSQHGFATYRQALSLSLAALPFGPTTFLSTSGVTSPSYLNGPQNLIPSFLAHEPALDEPGPLKLVAWPNELEPDCTARPS